MLPLNLYLSWTCLVVSIGLFLSHFVCFHTMEYVTIYTHAQDMQWFCLPHPPLLVVYLCRRWCCAAVRLKMNGRKYTPFCEKDTIKAEQSNGDYCFPKKVNLKYLASPLRKAFKEICIQMTCIAQAQKQAQTRCSHIDNFLFGL